GSSNPSRVRITLKELMPKLPKSFIQIHRSFIVNTLQISSIDKDYCRLKDGNRMTFGRFYKAQVLRYVSRRYKYDF
ncbi:MAG: LytTR family transcriptional regulator DNA-binding domain-containing protein, partial [Marinoscillum sp.]